ncbi:MAG: SpoIVB peptidase [Firmicutes bacterium]|nr:SpoIVB peptidase [Bacillota bacterium]
MLRKKYFGNLFLLIFIITLLTTLTVPWKLQSEIDDSLRLLVGEQHYVNTKLPLFLHVEADKEGILNLNGQPVTPEGSHIDLSSSLSIEALTEGQVNLKLSLFDGLITLKKITVNAFSEKELLPGGHSIGIKLHKEGVIAVGFYPVEDNQGRIYSPAEDAGVETSDIIVAVGGEKIDSLERAARLINYYGKKGVVPLKIKRGNQIINKDIPSVLCKRENEYRIGLYIRDTAAGVGTLTFVDYERNMYGALGHVITDLESNQPLKIDNGAIVKAEIINVKAAQKGEPGEKSGIFREDHSIKGTIDKNTAFGIFGVIENLEDFESPYAKPIPLGLAYQIEEGPAEILTVIEGDKIESFTVFIERIVNQRQPADKGLIIKIVDDRLIDLTGGIVQGMSGSPIIQNGRLVGAVTHVFVNDPTRGYGVLAEWMVEEILTF